MKHFTDAASNVSHTAVMTGGTSTAAGLMAGESDNSGNDEAHVSGPLMPKIADYATPEAYSEAVRKAGYLTPSTDGVLLDSEGLLRQATFDADGQLRFVDPRYRLSPLYELRPRKLRPEAAEILAEQERQNEAAYRQRDDGPN